MGHDIEGYLSVIDPRASCYCTLDLDRNVNMKRVVKSFNDSSLHLIVAGLSLGAYIWMILLRVLEAIRLNLHKYAERHECT